MNRQHLSPVLNKQSSASTTIVPSLVWTSEKRDTTGCSYGKGSMEIDAVRRSNMAVIEDNTANSSNHEPVFPSSSDIRVSRDIYSPIPRVTPTDTDPLDFPREVGPGPQSEYSLSSKAKFDSNSGMSFPAIKVECWDGEISNSAKFLTPRSDAKTNNKKSVSTKWNETDPTFWTQSNSKSLLVPSTLVRRRSTDGRLMVGLRDHLVESNGMNLSRAWSRSEGNIPVMSSTLQQSIPRLRPTRTTRDLDYSSVCQFHEINALDQRFMLGSAKSVLKPITKSHSFAGANSDDEQKTPPITSLPDSTESLTSLESMRVSPIQVDDNGLHFPRRLNSSQTSPKLRAKSISPRRLNQLEPLPQTGSTSGSDSSSGYGEDARQAVRFLTPQPKKKLTPIFRELSDQ